MNDQIKKSGSILLQAPFSELQGISTEIDVIEVRETEILQSFRRQAN